MKNGFFAFGLLSLLAFNNLYGDDGFDDESSIVVVKTDNKSEKDFTIYGSVSVLGSYNYAHKKPQVGKNDFRDFSSLKFSTDLNIEKKFENGYKLKSAIKAYGDFIYDMKDDEYLTTPKSYDKDGDINELYLQGAISKNLDFKIGRQIVVWGKSDNIRITDTLNPLDNRTPGMVDIEDLRLGVTMSKLEYFVSDWKVSGIVLHENRFSKNPEYGSDFAPPQKITTLNAPSNEIENSGVALSLSGNLQAQDIAFYYSNRHLDNTTYRSNMFGFAYNKVVDNFLFKTEIAYFSKLESKTDALIGFEYSGISEGSISLEIANKNDTPQYALRFTQSYLNKTLDFTALYSGFGKELQDGGFIRVWFDYDIDDKLSTSFGIMEYIGGDNLQREMIENNDRIFASLKYGF